MLKRGEILVWRAHLDGIPGGVLPPLLPQDAERADRFRSEEVRERFVRSHGVLRVILGSLGLQAVYDRDKRGKPRLIGHDCVYFNFARSNGWALYAVAMDVEVGADLERVRALPEYMQIAERYLPPTHFAKFLESPEETRDHEFFRIWARLEASLKALGVGLYGAGSELTGPWTVADIDAGEGFVAAVAAPADGLSVVVRDFAV